MFVSPHCMSVPHYIHVAHWPTVYLYTPLHVCVLPLHVCVPHCMTVSPTAWLCPPLHVCVPHCMSVYPTACVCPPLHVCVQGRRYWGGGGSPKIFKNRQNSGKFCHKWQHLWLLAHQKKFGQFYKNSIFGRFPPQSKWFRDAPGSIP